jgi:hypothetical protein
LQKTISKEKMYKRLSLIVGSAMIFYHASFSQEFTTPNCALKSHETLEITKVEIMTQKTVLYMSVENRITGGYFCADENIFIVYPDGTRSKLISSKGIPVCPDSYKFKTIGEKLYFTLTFPAMKHNTDWFDLIEDCTENCFSFYGVILDNDLNKKIDDAFLLVGKGNPAKALTSFIDIAETTDTKNSGVEGLLYISIIKLAKETGDTAKASEWYNKLKLSGIPRLESYIKNLDSQGIKY